jgi:hypothetical protein
MLAVLDEVIWPDMIALLRSPVDGSPQGVRFDATTLWHLDAAEWVPVHSIT